MALHLPDLAMARDPDILVLGEGGVGTVAFTVVFLLASPRETDPNQLL